MDRTFWQKQFNGALPIRQRLLERVHHIQRLTPVLLQVHKQLGHLDIYLSWGRVRLEIWTHKIDGLHDSDFVLAAKADRLA